MKLFQARIVTGDVPALTEFYQRITGATPVGGDDYIEFATVGGGLGICSKRSIDMFSASAAAPKSNQSIILDFQVEDVDRERARLSSILKEFVLEPTNQPWGNRSMLFR